MCISGPNGYSDRCTRPHSRFHRDYDTYTHSDTDTDRHADTSTHSYACAYGDTIADSHSGANANTNVSTNSHADSAPHGYTYPTTTHADSNAIHQSNRSGCWLGLCQG